MDSIDRDEQLLSFFLRLLDVDSTDAAVKTPLKPPGAPLAIDAGTSWVRLQWSEPLLPLKETPLYLVEVSESGDPTWFVVGDVPLTSNEFIGELES